MNSKWFDYRFLTPWDCTRLFSKTYSEQYGDAWRGNFDDREAHCKRGHELIRPGRDSREFTSFGALVNSLMSIACRSICLSDGRLRAFYGMSTDEFRGAVGYMELKFFGSCLPE